jgi:molybdenum cofactor synthesis domain-containing protein
VSKTAGILIIGNEILSGKTADENSPFLCRELRQLGVDVRRIAVVPDEVAVVAEDIRYFSKSHDYVFTSGGVGPTHDDVTMAGISAALNRPIRRDEEFAAAIRGYYPAAFVEPNLRMADIPDGARLLRAPGLWFPVVVVENVFVFPGVPEILRRKFTHIREMFRDFPYHLREVFLRADEGQISGALHAVLARFPDLILGSYPYFDNRPYTIKLTLESKDAGYLESAHTALLAELAQLALSPL